ncbi:MAG: 23S rRNA (adenine(2503)-C(2))-methyltransferase RlmN [Clostridia bacterium]|nr:23S rRNA (adenine(2503)-C(2))-methyltransferase RlmN [Clostridia bacterium]
MSTKPNLRNYTQDELILILEGLGEKPFRAKQIFKWLHKGAETFDEMTDISKTLKEKLSENFCIDNLVIEKKLVSKIDGTIKYLFRLNDGCFIESVIMKYKHGNTICVSSQVGCNMGCRFCASAIGGKLRNLETGEITDQLLKAQKDSGLKISNIVMMGIGEPLDNFDNVIRFLKNANHENGLYISARHITVSTCGVADKICELAKTGIPVTLSVSLHSPDNEKRSEIMPINKKYPIEVLLSAAKQYIQKTGRRVSIEYALISGETDSLDFADKLIKLLSADLFHVNLIPVNNVDERSYKKSSSKQIKKFMDYLNNHGLNATLRREMGSDINAACGQLRKQTMEQRGDNS